ncbi:MAG: ribosome silencing factor [Bacteroidota bacterium]
MAKKVPAKTSKPKAAAKKVSKTKTAAKKTAAPKKVATVKEKPAPKTKTVKRPVKTTNDGLEIALTLAQGMAERKAEDIRILDMRNVAGASTDYFVISHALSDKQVEAIADSAEEELFNKTKERPWHREGFENLEWVLLDYINVVAHVFQQEKRDFYAVEELWGDAVPVPFKAK